MEEKEKIYKYSSPKVLRLIEAISNFKPKVQPEGNTEKKELENSTDSEPNCCSFSNQQTIHCDNNVKLDHSETIEAQEEVAINSSAENKCKTDKALVIQEVFENNEIQTTDQLLTPNMNGILIETHLKTCTENTSEHNELKIKNNGDYTINDHENILRKGNSSTRNSKLNNNSNGNNPELINKHTSLQNNQLELIQNGDLAEENQLVFSDKNVTVIEDKAHSLLNGVSEHKCSDSLKDSNPTKETSLNNCSEADCEVKLNGLAKAESCCDQASSDNCDQTNVEKVNAGETEGVGRGGKWRGRGRGWRYQKKNFPTTRTHRTGSQDDAEQLCAIIFVENPFTAKILFQLFNVSLS